jgi:O-antigen/teichoic acid export membrane protein
MGMTWSLLGLLGIAFSYLSPKIPRFGMLVAQKKYSDLDTLFFKTTNIFSFIAVFTALMIFFLVWVLNVLNISLANRILPLLPTGLFLLAQLFMCVSMPFSYYMIAHKQNPLVALTVLNSLFTFASTVILGKNYNVTVVALGFLIIQSIMIPFIFLIWRRSRITWHSENQEE